MYILSQDNKTLIQMRGVQITEKSSRDTGGMFRAAENTVMYGLEFQTSENIYKILGSFNSLKRAVEEMESIADGLKQALPVYEIKAR